MAKIAIIGEAWGEQEEKEQTAFVGSSGYLLTKMLEEAGISRADCFLTNVINARPQANKIEAFCGGKADAIPGYPALIKGKYLRKEFEPELARLGDELIAVNPNLILAVGNTPLWALCGRTAISKARGTTCVSTHTVSGYKVLPTYHPAAVSRQWELRPIVITDFIKAKREAEFPEVRRPKREIWIEPTLEDLYEFERRYIQPGTQLAVDIETSGVQVTCIGFGLTSTAIVIPFVDARRKDRSYWPTARDERLVWAFIIGVLDNRRIRKTFQNGLYDIAFLLRSYGIRVMGATEDTMLLHHALQPESLKSLGFLGSIYTDEGAWKDLRKSVTTFKQDD